MGMCEQKVDDSEVERGLEELCKVIPLPKIQHVQYCIGLIPHRWPLAAFEKLLADARDNRANFNSAIPRIQIHLTGTGGGGGRREESAMVTLRHCA